MLRASCNVARTEMLEQRVLLTSSAGLQNVLNYYLVDETIVQEIARVPHSSPSSMSSIASW